ncbi:hypothetical protein [Campylobacter showae]|uniref:hypothetical protein n=1 Tax=Campylobacter showae TaxID=204 RepID=UPI0028D73527|nr:hypothetical protein [Campylobacter showae]
MKLLNKTIAAATCGLILAGCAAKEPTVITRTVYQEVKIPVVCIEEMPAKPKFKATDPQSARELMAYFKTCEDLLKQCVRGAK